MATNGTNDHKQQVSVLALLQRGDSRWATKNHDDPAPTAYLTHLAQYLQHLTPSDGSTPPTTEVDDRELARMREQVAAAETNAAARRAEADQLRAEVEQLQTRVDSEHREALRAVGALEAARRERDELAGRVQFLAGGALDELTQERDVACAEADELRAVTAEATKVIGALRADYDSAARDAQAIAEQLAAAHAERDDLAEQLAAATAHTCSWPWPGPDALIEPCSCGRPYPRYSLVADEDEVEPDVEPWDELFDRIRTEIEGTS